MALSKEQIKIIADHPLNDLLARLPDTLHALTESHGSWRADVAALLGILVDSTAAYNLLLSDGSGNVADKLFPVRQKVRLGGSLNFSHFRTLLDTIINKSPDTDVWSAVIALIDAVNPPTPPPSSIVRTACGTPVKTSSSRLADSETRDIIERELFYEIRDCTHRSVPGFFEKHFDSTKWTKKQKNMLRSILANHDGARWENFPANPLEAHVWDWLADLEAKALTGAAYSLHTNKSANEFKNRKGQMDIFFQKPSRSKSGRFYYKHVLIVGEHKRSLNTADFKACLLQLTRHVRSIFDDQPMRRFVHAFTIKATTMELWIFDRSGAYSSGEFDIHRDPEKFARALVAYATMDDESMGLDKSIDWESGSRYITIQNADGKSERVKLEQLLVKQRAVVCRGTTCFATKKGVAKFSWRSAKRQPSEVKHLQRAHEKGVEGVATLIGHSEIMTIADLRAGLDFSDKTRYNFRTTIHDRSDGYSRLQDTDTSRSSRKRKLLDEDTRPPARLRPNSQGSALGTACEDQTSEEVNDKAKPSLYKLDQNEPYENRILSCLVISPAGRVISDFHTIQELLETLRDAIRAHQSLYIKGRILHRDISSNNIIITKPETSGGFKGMLIDLDLAKERDSKPFGARNQTGTMQFMAIQVLRGADHTYRHDLESFFHVLLWLCALCAWDEKRKLYDEDEAQPAVSILRKWEIGNFVDIADAKEGHMTVNGVERIMDEFPNACYAAKSLCLRIRSLLFGDTARIMIGTPAGDPQRLYEAILTSFDEAIEQI
ncbi:serine/threonine-protein kinase Sgk2 [Metarhizium rileyi]|uniref:EKC/KEOPS complex subunit BUD32 n=1 Tax=Metarhizium rileyi (strain RCEF 4871) TaxID=1649241 RepID=A0A167KIZ6_METRR|nr:serine/threonine-protein kinase Sgk2 [Metarhizium rileyi RCEF 4871]